MNAPAILERPGFFAVMVGENQVAKYHVNEFQTRDEAKKLAVAFVHGWAECTRITANSLLSAMSASLRNADAA